MQCGGKPFHTAYMGRLAPIDSHVCFLNTILTRALRKSKSADHRDHSGKPSINPILLLAAASSSLLLFTFTNEFKIVKLIEVFYKLIPTIIPNEFQVVPTIADAAAAGGAAAAVAPFPFAPNTRRCLLLVARFLFCGARLLYVARLLASIDNRIVVSYDIGSRFGLLRIGQIQWHGFNIQ